jgi:DNA sulfur modification protein DndE
MENFNKIKVSSDVYYRLNQLKGSNRTQITPNLLARIAFCYSLNIPAIPDPEEYNEEGMEFNRYTLTGEYDSLMINLLKQRLIQDNLDPEKDFTEHFRAHINRGVMEIFSKIKSVEDIFEVLPFSFREEVRQLLEV